jgi:DNA polymerase
MTSLQKNILLKTLKQYKLCGIDYIEDINITKLNANLKKLPDTFGKLEEFTKNCNLCNLSKDKISCGFGSGNHSSEIFIVGVSQYQLENEAVYTMLKNMLEKVLMIDMEDVFLTNILKCTTKEEYKKLDNEINLCIDYLKKQISIAKPKLIITMGDAFNYLLEKNENINDISGNLYRYNNIKTIPILHPQFVYKNPSFKQQSFNDLKKIKLILEKL